MYARFEPRDGPSHRTGEPLAQPLDVIAEIFFPHNDDLSRSRWRRSPDIGCEVGYGEVDLVSDGRDDRHRRCDDRSRNSFVVERPQVFDRSAAAPDNHDIDPANLDDV